MTTHRLAVDIGGTFTDVVIQGPEPGTGQVTAKVPTTPADPVVGAMQGIDAVLQRAQVTAGEVGMVIHGTTLVTNTLIEKKGAVVGAILTEGFRDILEIGYERRYNQEDLFIDKPERLVPRERCLPVTERVSARGEVLVALNRASVARALDRLAAMGVQSVAVCLIHAYANPAHENQVADIIGEKYPELSVSVSSGVSPEAREYDRLSTTVANAYVKPMTAAYLDRFHERLRAAGFVCPLLMMTSSGGMTTLESARRFPIRLLESGPAGGAILAARMARRCGLKRVVSFDMGGTTAKFCIIDGGRPLRTRNLEIARAERFVKGSGIPVRIPVIDMIEIGAGGGSVADLDALDRITIGPRSMGAEPGPACFGRGGDRATVTDADAALGHVRAETFDTEAIAIDAAAAEAAIDRCVGRRLRLDARQAAQGILETVGENMANAGRVHAAERGAGLAGRSMIAFGGNGPLHACRVARKMGVSRIVVPRDPGVGSAVGFLAAPISYEIASSFYTTLDGFDFDGINALFRTLRAEALGIVNQANPEGALVETRSAYMRYTGQGHEIEVALPVRDLTPDDLPGLQDIYDAAYREQFKRIVPGMRVEIMNWSLTISTRPPAVTPLPALTRRTPALTARRVDMYFGVNPGWHRTPVYDRQSLHPGDVIQGPALVVEPQTSTLVAAGFEAALDADGNLVLELVDQDSMPRTAGRVDHQLMWNRLLAVVEEQAQALIHSAFSPIVRECGDISAGVFDARGRMLAQAVTGTPGHINTMANGVANFLKVFDITSMRPGDIYVTNDPWLAAGHLNDFMLVQPVFKNDRVIGFTACTSHLVDVGGLCMGPEGSDIYDEGILIPPCKLTIDGEINQLLVDIIKANSRRPVENEGDLYALAACCEVGAARLTGMLDDFSETTLKPLADFIIDRSERATLDTIGSTLNGVFEHAITLDGYEFEVELKARLRITDREVVLDLSGSSPCSRYGINVPLNYASAYAVFAIRCVMGAGVPNNHGSLAPFRVTAPEGCIVNAVHPAPVAMRHTIGQLLPDLVFGCLHQAMPDRVVAEGASCMYDLPMRNTPDSRHSRFAIELVHNGGTGARPGKDGLSATAYPSGVWGSQIEVTENTAPLRVHRRELRADSGGAGRFRGGLGQTIEMSSAEDADFLLFLSVDRRKYPARGRAGGLPGAPGDIRLRSGKVLPGRGQETIRAGDAFIMHTPGGGGYGEPHTRDPGRVMHDLNQGLISVDQATDVYAVVLDDAGNLDAPATRRLRAGEDH